MELSALIRHFNHAIIISYRNTALDVYAILTGSTVPLKGRSTMCSLRNTLLVVTVLLGLGYGRIATSAILPADIHYNQCSEPWSTETMGAPEMCDETVCSTGCIISCGAMLLSWVAQEPGNPDPGELNAWLRDNGGYVMCNVMWGAITSYDGSSIGLEWLGKESMAVDDWAALDAELDAVDRMPMVSVHGASHWVVVYERIGPSGYPSSYRIMDPAVPYSSDRSLADYPGSGQTIFGISRFSGVFPFGEVSGVAEDVASVLPRTLHNWPNPFNPRTTIAFEMPAAASVSLRVYDLGGRLVRVLLDGEMAARGHNEVIWQGRDRAGRVVSAGVYFYCLEAGGHVETKRMVLVK
ncbi:hypothetical protein DRQ50_15010 [bacterium]|nr:MAG: hypothetical protein DRQ50_15010 [bacterium]